MRVGGGFVRICRITFFVACFWGCYLPDQDKRRATLRTSIISLVLETWDQCGQFVEYVIILPITPTAFRGESLATKCSMLTLVWWLSKHKHFLIVQAIYVMQKVFQAIFLPDGSSLVHATFPSMAATPLTIWCTHSPPAPPNSILPSSPFFLPSTYFPFNNSLFAVTLLFLVVRIPPLLSYLPLPFSLSRHMLLLIMVLMVLPHFFFVLPLRLHGRSLTGDLDANCLLGGCDLMDSWINSRGRLLLVIQS